ncbi:MAG TPA: glycoside hydrolase family 2 TIM barrel-domain containing protein, partial [Solirubrobacteraceae bacterium]|nr:glycoside hydrolase family 2 TIM barrel-domain containing protein [Solirubrobacteraceae bacterium]
MPRTVSRTKAALAGAGICAVLAGILALGLLSPGAARPQETTVEAIPSSSPISEGPGGRMVLTRWTRRLDRADRGLAKGWRRGGFGGGGVQVPNVVEPYAWQSKTAEANFEGSVAWYETTFDAATAGPYAFTFQSANFYASAWVDGHLAGSHKGSYLPFELRTADLAPGSHTLVVRVDWRNPTAQERLGYHRTWFNWGGLGGPVEVRPIGSSVLLHPTIATTLPADTASPAGQVVCVRAPCPGAPAAQAAGVKVGIEVKNEGAAGRSIAVEGTLVHGSQTIALHFPEAKLGHGQAAVLATTVEVQEPALWSPSSPSLYRLTLAVGHESSYSAKVGLRQLTWHGGSLYLNGQHLQLHGASIQEDALGHGDALTSGDENAIVSELRATGANAARAQHPLYPGLLERLDAAGILVWQGVGPVEGAGNWYSNTPALLAGAEEQARQGAIAEQLHPSVFAWNLLDEVADNGHDAAEVRYVQDMTHWLHARDPARMVAVDVWGDHPPHSPGTLYAGVDAIAETDYSGWYDNPRNSPSAVSAEVLRRLRAMQRTFPGKVLVVSEFGAESNTLNPSGGPGSYGFQSALLARHIDAYRSDSQLTGMFIYLLRDYPLVPTFQGGSIHTHLPRLRLIEGLDQKGLYTYAG